MKRSIRLAMFRCLSLAVLILCIGCDDGGYGAKPPQFEYWVPIAGHASGNLGTNWRTDLGLYTGASVAANVQIRFPGATAQPLTATVNPGQFVLLADVVDQMHVSAFGPLQIISSQPLIVTSRTYNDQPGVGTMGQDLDGVSLTAMMPAGRIAVITQLTENADFRSNVGVLNAGSATANIRVELFDGSTGIPATTFTDGIPPATTRAYNRILFAKANLTNIASGYARITLLDGGPIVAYGSVLDNVTNDPTTIPMKSVPLVTSTGTFRSWIPIAGHLPGSLNTNWRTDLALLNLSGSTANVTLKMYASGGPYARTESLANGKQVIYRDVVAGLGFSGMAPLEISSDRALVATSRTYTENPDRTTIGQDLDSSASGLDQNQTGVVSHLMETSKYRSNLGVCNGGKTSANVTVTLFDGATGAQVGNFSESIPAGGLVSYGRIFKSKAGLSSLAAGYAKVSVTSGSDVIAYGSVLDNDTNDPTTMSMQRAVAWGGTPLTGSEMVNNAADVLGNFGTTVPGFETLVPVAVNNGPGAIVDVAVAADPTHVKKLPDGVRIDLGDGVTDPSGNTRAGVSTITWSNVVRTATRATGDFTATTSALTFNGREVPDMTITGTLDVNVRANGTVYGDITGSSVAAASPGSTLFKGSAHFDSSLCKTYPSSLNLYFREADKIATYAVAAGCTGEHTRTEAAAPTPAGPYPAETATLALWSFTSCGGQYFMNDWKITIDGAGNVTIGTVNNISNVKLTGGGTVRPNPDVMAFNDPKYLWNVPFTYTYTAVGGGQSFTITGNFNGSTYDGTITVGSCSDSKKGQPVTWH